MLFEGFFPGFYESEAFKKFAAFVKSHWFEWGVDIFTLITAIIMCAA